MQPLNHLAAQDTFLAWQSVSEKDEIVLYLEGTQPNSELFTAFLNLIKKPGELDF